MRAVRDAKSNRGEQYYQDLMKSRGETLVTLGGYAQYLIDIEEDNERGEAMFERALTLRAHDGTEDTAWALYTSLYASHLSSKDPDRAKRLYEQVLAAVPMHPLALGNMAVLIHRIGKNHDEAEHAYLRAIKAHPKHASIILKYANFLKHVRKDFDGAGACVRARFCGC